MPSSSRSHITVCDLHDDGYAIDGEYATSMLGIYTVPDPNGPRAGCGTDSTFFSRCMTLKGEGERTCADSVWIKRP